MSGAGRCRWKRPGPAGDCLGPPGRLQSGIRVAAHLIVLCLLGPAGLAAATPLADRVVIVAAGNVPGSMAIARHYAEVRHVPAANIIVLSPPAKETISWPEFITTVWNPLEDRLVKQGWIDAIPMDLSDAVGRRQYAVSGHRIAALVVCRGIPLRIANDPSLYSDVPPLTDHPQFRTNEGAVDSELSLLAMNSYPINASVPNPLYGNDHPTDSALAQVVKVARLDGPTTEVALGLVDRAVEAEQAGLLGRAYVDAAGPHENGNRWLEAAAAMARQLGFGVTVTRGPGTMPATARIDAPVLYLGWYSENLDGPFALPGFRFPPGAVADHIHSFSAQTLQSDSVGWCGPLLARGVTATVGNVFEPYLEFLHRPDLLLAALARGDTLVDAAYYALPVLSWQSIVIGDPLYRPFRRPVDDQVAGLAALPPATAGYAVLRQMNLLDGAARPAEALALGRQAMKTVPNLALALEVARRLADAGNADQSAWTLRAAGDAADPSIGNWELLREAGAFLVAHRRPAEGLELYRRLLDIEALPKGVRLAWLGEARAAALAAGETAQAADWDQEAREAAPAH